MINVKYIFLACVIFGLLMSCEQPLPVVKLDNADYKIVDSLVKIEKIITQVEVDSMCGYYKTTFYDNAVDSIHELRTNDIKEILGE